MKGKIAAVLMLVGFFLTLLTSEARANGMPSFQYLGSLTGNLIPTKDNRVGVISEELYLKAIPHKQDLISNPQMDVGVHVMYRLQNHTTQNLSLQVAFPQSGYTRNWAVQLDGQEITLDGEGEVAAEIVADSSNESDWVDPVSGEKYSLQSLRSYRQINAQTFTVLLHPGINNLQLDYMVEAGIDEYGRFNPIYRFDYLLTPAKYWADFHNLNLTIELPAAYALYSSLPLDNTQDNLWKGTFATLPEENLHIFFANTSGSWGGLIVSRKSAVVLLGVVLCLLALGRKVLRRTLAAPAFRMVNLILSTGASWLVYITLNHKIITYPFNPFQYVLFWGLLLWLWRSVIKDYLGGDAPSRLEERDA